MNRYGVIMAGGGGTRFWPLSRQKLPKQLLNLSGNDLMVNEAVDRMATVINKSNIFIVTSDMQAPSMITATAGKVFPRNILAEPAARNTTACIGYAAMEIVRKYGDGVMVITPSDHYIQDVKALTEIFEKAIYSAEEDRLITIGIRPVFPATGFGYIRFQKSKDPIKRVLEFREKPDEEAAKFYVNSGNYLWNSGMFVWKAGLILRKLKKYVPDIYEDLIKIGEAMNTPQEQEILHEIYPRIRNISIDYAVMEPAAADGDVLVVPGDCGWNDIGSWDMLDVLHPSDEKNNVLLGDVTVVNVSNSVIYSQCRAIAALDVDNIVIVETPDVILVCRKDKAQNVRQIVDTLAEHHRSELL